MNIGKFKSSKVMVVLLGMVLAFCSLGMSFCKGDEQNLLQNPGFEGEINKKNNMPCHWSIQKYEAEPGSIKASLDNTVVFRGKRSLKYQTTNSKDVVFVTQKWLNLEKGKSYRFKGFYKAVGSGSSLVCVQVRRKTQSKEKPIAQTVYSASEDWAEFVTDFTVPEDDGRIKVLVFTYHKNVTCWLDEMSIRRYEKKELLL